MKTLTVITSFILLTGSAFSSYADASCHTLKFVKGPVVIEVLTDHGSAKEALLAVKTALLQEKFILDGGIQETSFTAKRTTGSEADYYVADVMVEKEGERFKITVTFVKIGTGLLKLEKVADKIKSVLEK